MAGEIPEAPPCDGEQGFDDVALTVRGWLALAAVFAAASRREV